MTELINSVINLSPLARWDGGEEIPGDRVCSAPISQRRIDGAKALPQTQRQPWGKQRKTMAWRPAHPDGHKGFPNRSLPVAAAFATACSSTNFFANGFGDHFTKAAGNVFCRTFNHDPTHILGAGISHQNPAIGAEFLFRSRNGRLHTG